MNNERQWTLHITRLEPAGTPRHWIVGYTLHDQDFPHRIDHMLVPANDEMEAFYALQEAVKSWIDQGPFYERNIKIVWFKEEV
jgi:hypothetical protein